MVLENIFSQFTLPWSRKKRESISDIYTDLLSLRFLQPYEVKATSQNQLLDNYEINP